MAFALDCFARRARVDEDQAVRVRRGGERGDLEGVQGFAGVAVGDAGQVAQGVVARGSSGGPGPFAVGRRVAASHDVASVSGRSSKICERRPAAN